MILNLSIEIIQNIELRQWWTGANGERHCNIGQMAKFVWIQTSTWTKSDGNITGSAVVVVNHSSMCKYIYIYSAVWDSGTSKREHHQRECSFFLLSFWSPWPGARWKRPPKNIQTKNTQTDPTHNSHVLLQFKNATTLGNHACRGDNSTDNRATLYTVRTHRSPWILFNLGSLGGEGVN